MSSPNTVNRLVLGLLTIAVIGAAPAHADRCMGAKLRAIARLESGLLVCRAKVAASGDSSGLSDCRSKALAKFDIGFRKAGSCVGDQAMCESIADGCESLVAATFIDTFPSHCEAAKRKAAASLAKGVLGCDAKAAARELRVGAVSCRSPLPKFSRRLTDAGTCPDGGEPQVLVENACVAPAVTTDIAGTVTDVCPTSTTTTSTTSTTTTTLCGGSLQPCCAGSCFAGLECAGGICQTCGLLGGPCCNGTICISAPLDHCVGGICLPNM